MKNPMSLMFLPVLLVVGLMAYIRLAPTDPAFWNQPLATDLAANAAISVGKGSGRVALFAPSDALIRLNAIALATPRSTLIAGSPAEGRMTWQIRSAFFGFPDYVTAQVTDTPSGPRLDILSRLRFGRGDFGVNATRLRDWLAKL